MSFQLHENKRELYCIKSDKNKFQFELLKLKFNFKINILSNNRYYLSSIKKGIEIGSLTKITLIPNYNEITKEIGDTICMNTLINKMLKFKTKLYFLIQKLETKTDTKNQFDERDFKVRKNHLNWLCKLTTVEHWIEYSETNSFSNFDRILCYLERNFSDYLCLEGYYIQARLTSLLFENIFMNVISCIENIPANIVIEDTFISSVLDLCFEYKSWFLLFESTCLSLIVYSYQHNNISILSDINYNDKEKIMVFKHNQYKSKLEIEFKEKNKILTKINKLYSDIQNQHSQDSLLEKSLQ